MSMPGCDIVLEFRKVLSSGKVGWQILTSVSMLYVLWLHVTRRSSQIKGFKTHVKSLYLRNGSFQIPGAAVDQTHLEVSHLLVCLSNLCSFTSQIMHFDVFPPPKRKSYSPFMIQLPKAFYRFFLNFAHQTRSTWCLLCCFHNTLNRVMTANMYWVVTIPQAPHL